MSRAGPQKAMTSKPLQQTIAQPGRGQVAGALCDALLPEAGLLWVRARHAHARRLPGEWDATMQLTA